MVKCIAVCFFAVVLMGCAVDPLDDLSASDEVVSLDNPELIRAWLWAFNTLSDSIVVYHTIDKLPWETFYPAPVPQHGFHVGGFIGGGIYSTLWTWRGSVIYSITNGILDHGDHGHIVHPYSHKTIKLNPLRTITSLSVSPDGTKIVAGVIDSTSHALAGEIVLIQYLTGDTSVFYCSIPVTLALSCADNILAAWEHATVASVYDASSGRVVQSVVVDTLVSSGVFYSAASTAFLACRNGITMIDMTTGTAIGQLAYTSEGRVTSFYPAKEYGRILGLFKPDVGECNRVLILDMKNKSVGEVAIDGALLASGRDYGRCTVSDDGRIAILADEGRPILYRISLESGGVEQAAAPDSACPVACNRDGTRVWALAHAKAYQISFETDAFVDSIPVPAQTTGIMVTSFGDNSALFDSKDHTF